MDPFEQALKFIQAGRLDEARIYFEELLKQDPENEDILYNLGMLYTELGRPDSAVPLLKKCIEISPGNPNAHVALGFAYMNLGDLKNAKDYTLEALKIAPDNPFALKNLGGISGKERDYQSAFYYLKKSYEINPQDPQTVYGLAFAYKSLNDLENAEKYFKDLLDMTAPETLKELGREGLGEIAFKTLKSSGPRMDVVFYMISALKMFEDKRLIPAKPKDPRAMLQEIEGDLNRISKLIPMQELVRVVGMWTDGLVRQLTNYPPDIMIEKWIYDGYPELRPYQLQSLERQNQQALKGISRNVQVTTPAKIYNSSNIMNFVFFNLIGSHIKADLARPYRNTPFSKKGKQLMQLTEKDYVNSYEGDRSMIDRWAEFLGLTKWYSWVGFENVPPDYLNSV